MLFHHLKRTIARHDAQGVPKPLKNIYASFT